MRIRRNSEYAKRHYLKEVCVVNQNPWDILGPLIELQSQTDGENEDFCGLTSFGKTVKDLLSEMILAEKVKDEIENEWAVYCSFTDARGINCGVEAKAGSHYCEVHVQLPRNCSTHSGTRRKRGVKKVTRGLKRKMDDSTLGEEIIYYARFPGLRRKRGCPPLKSQDAANNVDE